MKIIRNGQEIELTGLECHQVYKEMQKEYYIDDIGNKVREDYEIEPCTDDSNIDLGELARRFDRALGNNDSYWDDYWYTMDYVIKEYLKEKGIK